MIRKLLLALALLAAPASQADAAGLESIQLIDATGTPTPLTDLLPQAPTILHLWATWCAPCRKELPAVERFAEELARQGLADRLIVVSTDSMPFERIQEFLDELGLKTLHTWQAQSGNPGTALQVLGYPTTLILDAQGIVIERHQGPLDWDNEVARADFLKRLDE